ncbi:MAG TPA: agmatine deiminase family protein [Gammaproteobacteria bacterium]|nr:agmatine deiminase family protein [Gammaproteobacteria bacterium]
MYRSKIDYVPAEWERQDGVLLTWPRHDGDWSPLWHDAIAHFAELASIICRSERLIIACPDEDRVPEVQASLLARGADPARFRCCWVPSDDTWSRDFGAIACIQNGKPLLLDFRFNAWGGKYSSSRDDAINGGLSRLGAFAAPLKACDFILEGGSIESDGAGTLLTTSRCLLSEQRNSAERSQVEAQLKKWLPIQRVLWLDSGYLAGDDTDSHIDNLARFADPHTILYVQCTDSADEHYAALKAMEAELKSFTDASGKPYQLRPLPMPQPVYSIVDGRRLPASYLNFLVLNDAVLVPAYDGPADFKARDIIADSFLGRRVIGIDSRTFIEQNGGVHCLTMQFTAGTLNPEFFQATAEA